MGVQFTSSADKHGIPREDSLYAIMHAEVSAEVDGEPGEVTMVYVGTRTVRLIATSKLSPRTVHREPL